MKLSGTVLCERINQGSKSERVGYRIVAAEGASFPLYHAGDNPFSNVKLAPYAGHAVEVTGELDGDLLVVTGIRRLD
jgi:hypothetical protein